MCVGRMRAPCLLFLVVVYTVVFLRGVASHGDQPLSRFAIYNILEALDVSAHIEASPNVLGLEGKYSEWVTVEYSYPNPSSDDWIGVFSPANFSADTCLLESPREYPPSLCSAPIKYQYANFSTRDYVNTGNGTLKFQLINQRYDFSFALFTGGILNPKLVAVSNKISFVNPKAPVYPRLAQGICGMK